LIFVTVLKSKTVSQNAEIKSFWWVKNPPTELAENPPVSAHQEIG